MGILKKKEDFLKKTDVSSVKKIKKFNFTQSSKYRKYFFGLSFLLYITVFAFLVTNFNKGGGTSAFIVIITISWFYGLKAGIIAGVASFPVNILMYMVTGYDPSEMFQGSGLFGTFSLITLGAIVGRMSDLSVKLNISIRDLENALKQVKVLRGLLPICASCKNIRDDSGYWTQIESYISSHSDAQFSHSICPDCAEKLYGHEEWYKEYKKKES
ncbi:hypothetical protein ACFL20_02410 [Spirochaetota bacterium]